MTFDLMNYDSGNSLLPRDARQSGRAVSHQSGRGLVRRNCLDIETDLAHDKADGLTAVTGSAIRGVATVAQMQVHCEQLVPQASGRINMLADTHALLSAGMVEQYGHSLRRL